MSRSLLSIAAALALVAGGAMADETPRAEFLAASAAPLGNPHDLKLSPDGSRLFVADVRNSRVAILDAETLALVGAFGADHLDGTHDVDFDAAGRVLVADTHNDRVTIYEMEGLEARLVGVLAERIRGPEGVLAHPNGRVYVAGAASNNVVAYEDGKPVAELNGLSAPHDLELAPNGDIWLADAGADRMVRLSPDLEIEAVLQGGPYDFDGVRYLDVLPDGALIVADKNNHQVKLVSPMGEVRLVIGSGRPRMGPGEFTTPEGIEARDDIVWISDSGNDRVVKYRLTR